MVHAFSKRDIADQCLFYGGPAVLEARALLTARDTSLWFYGWEDSCITVGSKTNELERHQQQEEKLQEDWDYRLIPNLFQGDKTAIITLQHEEQGSVEVYNIQGMLVGIYKVGEGSNVLALDKSINSAGVYIYKVFVGNELRYTDKLVVVE